MTLLQRMQEIEREQAARARTELNMITPADLELAAQDPQNTLELRAIRLLDNEIKELENGLHSLKFARAVLQHHRGKAAQLQRERDQLYGYVLGLIGLLQLVRARDDMPPEIGNVLRTNHRVVDAAAYLTQIVPPVSGDNANAD